jgi:uncharacterized protein (UPF0332 family)
MTTADAIQTYLFKAQESLAGAASEFANGRYNNCANRCYYACFQAAIVALLRAGIRPRGSSDEWSHAFVPARFDGELVNRRKLYPSELRGVLGAAYVLRQTADYELELISQTRAERALRRTRAFVQTIQSGGSR